MACDRDRFAAAPGRERWAPLQLVSLPFPCGNGGYEERVRAVIGVAQADGIEGIAFGDLFLADVRQYRKRMM